MATVPIQNSPPVAAVSPDIAHTGTFSAPVIPTYATVRPIQWLDSPPPATTGHTI